MQLRPLPVHVLQPGQTRHWSDRQLHPAGQGGVRGAVGSGRVDVCLVSLRREGERKTEKQRNRETETDVCLVSPRRTRLPRLSAETQPSSSTRPRDTAPASRGVCTATRRVRPGLALARRAWEAHHEALVVIKVLQLQPCAPRLLSALDVRAAERARASRRAGERASE